MRDIWQRGRGCQCPHERQQVEHGKFLCQYIVYLQSPVAQEVLCAIVAQGKMVAG